MEKKKIPDALQPGEKIIDIEDAEEVNDYIKESIENGDLSPEEWHDYYGRMQDWIFRTTHACMDVLEVQAENFFTMTKAQLKQEAIRVIQDREPACAMQSMFITSVADHIKNFRKPFDKKTGAEELKTLLPTIRALLTGEDFGNSISADCFTMFEVDPDHPKDHPPLWWFIVDEARTYYADQKKDEAELQELAPDKAKARPRLPLTLIRTFSMMNDKLNKTIIANNGVFDEQPNGQMRIVWGFSAVSDNKPEVPSLICLQYEGDAAVKVRKLTAFDEAVYNTISTLYYNHTLKNPGEILYITPEEVWRVMNGKQAGDRSVKPTPKQIDRIRASIDFMSYTRCSINLQAQIDAHLITIDDERVIAGEMADTLISAPYMKFTTETGQIKEGYAITRPPILYTYNAAKRGALLFFNFDLLDTTGEINNSENVIEFRGYLLREIKVMRQHAWTGDYSTRIKLATLYEKTGIEPPADRKEAKKNRDKIEGMLTAWMKKGFIESFLPVKEGKAHNVIGYDITLPDPKDIEEAHKPGRIEKKKKK